MNALNYYCYVSRFKVNQLYEQLGDFSVEEASVKKSTKAEVKGEASGGLFHIIKAGLSGGYGRGEDYEEKGVVTTLQKLKKVLLYLDGHESIINLNDRLERKLKEKADTNWFLYLGKFKADTLYYRAEKDSKYSKELLLDPGMKENKYKEVGPNQGSLVSGMCILHSQYEGYRIQLACSLKYFSDMGGSWSEDTKEWWVGPHSGNYHFFSGSADTSFETLIFVNGIKGKTIMGTPLFLIHKQDPKHPIYI